MLSQRSDVPDRMCDSILVLHGCFSDLGFNPCDGFEQRFMSAVVQVDFLFC